MHTANASGLSEEQVEVLATTLFHLASTDAIDAREEQLIREFLGETGSDVRYEDLATMPYSPLETAQVFPTSFHRKVVLKSAVALIRADGQFSAPERRALGELADVLGVSNADFGDLEREAVATGF